ncbi:EAL domain-containing protein [Massilia sp. PAMC28688]|uniref:putative bifunctional diguanylate cyclase/phosphodiesterase n=1 Tax=Massilia sp. PAMC28688 TaxID=2861283 RepID=UPI001C627329|nr:bifunctional diguanylate cyclase/phosphodiesterase [Massilia sp. PAMC28688]QYF92076.1 EAL domain-containing protein [Massilia sp. PAMC28688]
MTEQGASASSAIPRIPDDTLVQIAGRIAHLGGFIVDLAADRVFWSNEVCDIYGVPHGTTPSPADTLAYYPPEWRARATQVYLDCAERGIAFDEEVQILRTDGTRKWIRATAHAVRDADGNVTGLEGALQDIDAAKHADHERRLLANRLTTTLESITDGVVMVDRQWRFTFINSVAERLLHSPREQVLGTSLWDRFPEAVGGRYYEEYHRAIATNCSTSFEEYYAPLDLWTEIRAYPSEEGLAIYFLDIRERKMAQDKIHALAYYDKLTGLPNRELLLARLEEAVSTNRELQRHRALLIIDLDNFKSINDTRGHEKGDQLLLLVASRLRRCITNTDLVARFGGDEFVIVLDDLGTEAQAADKAARHAAGQLLTCFAASFDIDGIALYSSASIGVTVFDGEALTPDELLKRADLAMYQAKAAGRNGFAMFSPEIASRLADRVALEHDLRRGLTSGQFLLHYQPLARVGGAMTGVEALVRWNHPVRGLVPPNDFITPAEESGLILPLGQWVMHTACSLLASWAADPATSHLTMAVNVSAHQLYRADFVAQVMTVLAATGASPHRLKLELTESLLVNDVEGTIAKMVELKAAGVRFSLDDFGTGYSSLSYLYRLPLSQLKIDKSFVRDAIGGQQGAAIAHTILALGRTLRLSVLAEGVETREQHDFIAGAGCAEYQGYLYSRPLDEERLAQFMAAALPRHPASDPAVTLPW